MKKHPHKQLKSLLRGHSKEKQQAVCRLVDELLKLNIDSEFIGCITHAFSLINGDSAKKANEFAVFIQKQAYSSVNVENS
jgi:hypothetical protein